MTKVPIGNYKVTKDNVNEVAKQAAKDVATVKETLFSPPKDAHNPILVGIFDSCSTEDDFKYASELCCALSCLQSGENDDFICKCGVRPEALAEAKQKFNEQKIVKGSK